RGGLAMCVGAQGRGGRLLLAQVKCLRSSHPAQRCASRMTMSAAPSQQAVLPFRDFFALDVRSLALFRICLAVLLLLDWAERLPDLGVFYTDAGLLPRSYLRGGHPVSVMLLSGSLGWQAFVALLAVVFGLMLLVGWRTPLAAFASYVLL